MNRTVFETWQLFLEARRLIPKVYGGIYRRVSDRSRYAWAANPRSCEVVMQNPLDRMETLLFSLYEAGGQEIAIEAVDYLAAVIGRRTVSKETSRSDKGSVDGEIADLTMSMGDFAGKLRSAVRDRILTPEEHTELMAAARRIVTDVEQAIDAGNQECG